MYWHSISSNCLHLQILQTNGSNWTEEKKDDGFFYNPREDIYRQPRPVQVKKQQMKENKYRKYEKTGAAEIILDGSVMKGFNECVCLYEKTKWRNDHSSAPKAITHTYCAHQTPHFFPTSKN